MLINYGERGDKLYLIRYGKVKVMRPDDKGGRIEVVQLGRGQFVGERTLITGQPPPPPFCALPYAITVSISAA